MTLPPVIRQGFSMQTQLPSRPITIVAANYLVRQGKAEAKGDAILTQRFAGYETQLAAGAIPHEVQAAAPLYIDLVTAGIGGHASALKAFAFKPPSSPTIIAANIYTPADLVRLRTQRPDTPPAMVEKLPYGSGSGLTGMAAHEHATAKRLAELSAQGGGGKPPTISNVATGSSGSPSSRQASLEDQLARLNAPKAPPVSDADARAARIKQFQLYGYSKPLATFAAGVNVPAQSRSTGGQASVISDPDGSQKKARAEYFATHKFSNSN
jgi:hypothetical protein